MFSSRLPTHLTMNAVAELVARTRREGRTVLDLTESNPTAVGLDYPPDLLASLADTRGLSYRPLPQGSASARDAVAATYRHHGTPVDARDLILTASTSEAYAFLFKLLCDPGDLVLVPRPSYPLFDLLAGLEGIGIAPYRLDPAAGWSIDRSDLERALTPRVRAILVVSPNNPTGSMLRMADREWLGALAADRGLAIISDEVFAQYPISPHRDATTFAGYPAALTFTLGGLSKSAGLPQIKVAWIAVSGPPALTAPALERLELIADTYLSVSTPAQIALPSLIGAGNGIRQSITERLRDNLAWLCREVSGYPALTVVAPEGGWSVVLRVPAIVSEEALVLRLLETSSVLVHPGYFFDFSEEAYLVLSLLPMPAVFQAAVARLVPFVGDPGL